MKLIPAIRSVKRLLAAVGLEVIRLRNKPHGWDFWFDMAKLFGREEALTIFDVGANIGQSSESFVRLFPQSKVYAFEPVPGTCEQLKRRATRLPQVECVCCALGNGPGSIAMNIYEHSVANSLLRATATTARETAQARVVTGDSFCGERGIRHIDILKIDTQGYDLHVLRGAAGMISSGAVSAIKTEVLFSHLYENQAYFTDILAFLSERNYRLSALYTGTVDAARALVWGDALFVHKDFVSAHARRKTRDRQGR